MPTYKRSRAAPRSRARGRKPYRRRSAEQSVANMAVTAYRGFKYIKGLVNSELFKYDIATSTNITSTEIVYPIAALPQGDGNGNRTGTSVLGKSVWLQSILQNQSTTASAVVRAVLVVDLQQGADTPPAWTDIFTALTVQSALNVNTVGRFSIKLDENIIVAPSTQQGGTKVWKKFIPMNHHVRYNGTLATDIQKGGLYLLLLSAGGTVSQASTFRFSYHDN